jgi:vesicle transport protein SEC22
MAIASDKMVFYYLSRDNLCFLTLCEESYPKRQAFLYLDDIADIIMAELLKEHGTNVRTAACTYTTWRLATKHHATP